MHKKSPYTIIQSRYVTEKSRVLEELKDNTSNKYVAACKSPKYVFLVDKKANKQEIAQAIEEIYAAKKIKVKGVNTINVKPKEKRIRGRIGFTSGFKKAIVTLDKDDELGESI